MIGFIVPFSLARLSLLSHQSVARFIINLYLEKS